MYAKKRNTFKSPDTSRMQEVLIDDRTRIYIPRGADPVEAKARYIERMIARENGFVRQK